MKHFFAPSGWSKGKHLMVALVSSFTFSSSASLKFTTNQSDRQIKKHCWPTSIKAVHSNTTYLADHGPLAHLPSAMTSFSSPYELTSTILLQGVKRLLVLIKKKSGSCNEENPQKNPCVRRQVHINLTQVHTRTVIITMGKGWHKSTEQNGHKKVINTSWRQVMSS